MSQLFRNKMRRLLPMDIDSPPFDFEDVRNGDIVIFYDEGGRYHPTSPWPQVFYVSDYVFDHNFIEVRPLTITSLVKGLFSNAITMNWFRILSLFYWIGFISFRSGRKMSFSNWTWHPIDELKRRKREDKVHKSYEEMASSTTKGFPNFPVN